MSSGDDKMFTKRRIAFSPPDVGEAEAVAAICSGWITTGDVVTVTAEKSRFKKLKSCH